MGISQILSSFFTCHCSAASLSRSAVQDDQGGRTQIAALINCSIILLVLVALASLFEPLPTVKNNHFQIHSVFLMQVLLNHLNSLNYQFRNLKKNFEKKYFL